MLASVLSWSLFAYSLTTCRRWGRNWNKPGLAPAMPAISWISSNPAILLCAGPSAFTQHIPHLLWSTLCFKSLLSSAPNSPVHVLIKCWVWSSCFSISWLIPKDETPPPPPLQKMLYITHKPISPVINLEDLLSIFFQLCPTVWQQLVLVFGGGCPSQETTTGNSNSSWPAPGIRSALQVQP